MKYIILLTICTKNLQSTYSYKLVLRSQKMRIKADFGIKYVFEGMGRQKVSIYKTSTYPAFLLFGLPVH